MSLAKRDILIPIREGENNPSLRYALRSIAENFPHRKVWLGGYKPEWVSDEVGVIPVSQGSSPYRNVHNILKAAVTHEELSDDFTFFNDDFYVLRPVKTFLDMYDGTLAERVHRLRGLALGSYARGAEITLDLLQAAGFEEPKNYDLHVPMLMSKVAVDDTLGFIDRSCRIFWPHMRSVYAALNGVEGVQFEDVKITTQIGRPSPHETYLSTSLRSLVTGSAGWVLRKQFWKYSPYELPENPA